MIVALAGKTEADGNDIEKSWLGESYARASKILSDMKGNLVSARAESIALEDRAVDATVVIRDNLCQQRALRKARQGQGQTGRRSAGAGVEHVCRQSSGHLAPSTA